MNQPSAYRAPTRLLRSYAEAALMIAAATLVGLAIVPRWGGSAVDLLFLPAVLAAAILGGRGPALFAAGGAALAYNFFFTAPHLTFRIDNVSDIVTVCVLFGVALVTSQLAASVRRQARLAQAHADRNATIAGLARRLLSCSSDEQIAQVAVSELHSVFDCNTVLLTGLPSPRLLAALPTATGLAQSDMAVAAMVIDSGHPAGRGLDRSVPTDWQFHPIRSAGDVIAAIGIARDDGAPAATRAQFELLDNLLDQLALAFERSRLEREALEFAQTRERDRVRSTLLAAIGEELCGPLAVVRADVDAMRRQGEGDGATLGRLASETAKLDRYLGNLLEVAPPADQPPVQHGDICIDLYRRTVQRAGVDVHLAPKEWAVLAELAKQPGRVLSHAHLLRTAWGPAQESQLDYLRVAIRGLRQKLERDPAHPVLIRNEPAVGYRLDIGK